MGRGERAPQQPQIFLSYDEQSHAETAASIASALRTNDISVWHDKRARESIRRRLSSVRGSEFGLDAWLRRGLLTSDMIVSLIPDRQMGGASVGGGVRSGQQRLSASELVRRAAPEITRVREHYEGSVPSDEVPVDQLLYYMVHPIHWWRSAFYEDRFGVSVGKDPFESWRLAEARMAGAFGLVPVCVVMMDGDDGLGVDEVAAGLADLGCVVAIRYADVAVDVDNVLAPTVRRRAPDADALAAIRRRQAEFRRLRLPAFVRGAGMAIWSIVLLIGLFLFALLWDLVKYGGPLALVVLAVYAALRWVGLI